MTKDLPADKFQIQNDGIRLLTNNYYETDFGSPKDWFVLKEGSKIVEVKLEGTMDEQKKGVNLNDKGIVCATPELDQTDLSGKIIVTIKDKNGIITHEDCAIYVSRVHVQWMPSFEKSWGGTLGAKVRKDVLIYTDYAKGTGIASIYPDDFLVLSGNKLARKNLVSICPVSPSPSNPKEGILYDSEGKVIPASFSIYYSGESVTTSCQYRGAAYTYVKVTAKESDGSIVTQILKIRFDWTE